jgi:hypothetical protein
VGGSRSGSRQKATLPSGIQTHLFSFSHTTGKFKNGFAILLITGVQNDFAKRKRCKRTVLPQREYAAKAAHNIRQLMKMTPCDRIEKSNFQK